MGINSSKDGGIVNQGATSADSVIPSKRRSTSRPFDQSINNNDELSTPRSLGGSTNDLNAQIFDQESDGIVPNVFKWDHGTSYYAVFFMCICMKININSMRISTD